MAVAGVCSCDHENSNLDSPKEISLVIQVVAGANSCNGTPLINLSINDAPLRDLHFGLLILKAFSASLAFSAIPPTYKPRL